jgi:hypothetical protein
MSRKERGPAATPGPHKVAPSPSAPAGIVPRGGDVVSLDPDLWVALAALDRTFGADQVALVRVVPRSRT